MKYINLQSQKVEELSSIIKQRIKPWFIILKLLKGKDFQRNSWKQQEKNNSSHTEKQ